MFDPNGVVCRRVEAFDFAGEMSRRPAMALIDLSANPVPIATSENTESFAACRQVLEIYRQMKGLCGDYQPLSCNSVATGFPMDGLAVC